MTAATIVSTVQAFPWSRRAKRLARMWANAQRRRRIARTARAFKALDDRTLAEMDVTRENIHAYAARLENGGIER
jgi:uncharacterized protein YjiS (DUF1127 family)